MLGGGQIRNVTIKQKSRIFDGGNQILNVTKQNILKIIIIIVQNCCFLSDNQDNQRCGPIDTSLNNIPKDRVAKCLPIKSEVKSRLCSVVSYSSHAVRTGGSSLFTTGRQTQVDRHTQTDTSKQNTDIGTMREALTFLLSSAA